MSGRGPGDPFCRLRPPPPTPASELCGCDDGPPVLLQPHLAPNPLSCARCNLEVPPETLGFPGDLAQELADWRGFHDAFFTLWLDSGEYEAFAAEELEDPTRPVNARGRALAAALARWRPAFLWLHRDEPASPEHDCPACRRPLETMFAGERPQGGSLRVCRGCLLAIGVG